MKKSKILFTLTLCSLLAPSVYSQTTSSTNTSVIDNARSILSKIKPDRISHFSIFNGPSIGGGERPNEFDGAEDGDGISSWHQISFGYQLTKDTRFVVNPRFLVDYNAPNETTGINESRASLDNPVLGINSTWYKNGRFSWSGSVNTVFWLFDEEDREDGQYFNPGGFQTMNYQVTPKLGVGTWWWARYRYFANNDERDKLPIFVSPYLSYNFTDDLGLITFYQVNGEVPTIDKINWDQDDHLNLLISWKINNLITLQPIVTVFRETDFALDKGNFNLWVSGRFF